MKMLHACGATDLLPDRGPAPYHARTLGKRLAWASEVPEHYSPFVTWKVRQSAAGSLTRVPGTSCLRLCWWQQAITLPV